MQPKILLMVFLILCVIYIFISKKSKKIKKSKYCNCGGTPGCRCGTPGCRCGTPGCLGCTCGAMSNGTYKKCKCGRCVFSTNRGALGTCM